MTPIQKEHRESTLIREVKRPELNKRSEARRKVEAKKDFSALALSEKDHFEKMWKELEL